MTPELIAILERFRARLLASPAAAHHVLSLYAAWDTEQLEEETIQEMIREIDHTELLALIVHTLQPETAHS